MEDKGLFVVKARGRTEDPDDVLNGFCLRMLGRLVELGAYRRRGAQVGRSPVYVTGSSFGEGASHKDALALLEHAAL